MGYGLTLTFAAMSTSTKEWFAEWFNSPYYHILYRHHDDEEAKQFIDHLITFLKPAPGARMLDLACGRGRHARYLCDKGFEVTGIDLSPANIEKARQLQCGNLFFEVHDMRHPYRSGYFQYVFNFFTSFGYFDNVEDNQATVDAIADGLVAGGYVVIDFLNAQRVIDRLTTYEEKTVKDIHFQIEKQFRPPFIEKEIRFTDQGQSFHFKEQVQALCLADFQQYFSRAGLTVEAVFGNYALAPFDAAQSDRLIVLGKKP